MKRVYWHSGGHRTLRNRLSQNLALSLSGLLSSLSFMPLVPASPALAQHQIVQAQMSPPSSSLENALQFTPPKLPDRGRPGGRSSGGASRGSCDTTGQLPLTALVPVTSIALESTSPETTEANSPTYDSVFSLTGQTNPTFWFYVPYALNETPVEFVLQDEQNNTLYQTRLTSDRTDAGIVSIALPEGALQAETLHHWYFMAYCDESNPAFVEGWTEHTVLDPSLSASLLEATPREQALLYARNGIWQEAITLIGEQYRTDPNNLEYSQDWNSLLNSVALGEVAQEPLTNCCGQ